MGWNKVVLAAFDSLEAHADGFDPIAAPPKPIAIKTSEDGATFPWHYASSLLQESSVRLAAVATGCAERPADGSDWCKAENAHIAALLTFLLLGILTVLCLFSHIREDKEEQITPLCPQLIVKGTKPLRFRLVLDPSEEVSEVVDSETDAFICRVIVEWPDPLRPGRTGVAATVRLQNALDHTLATIVARSVAVQGQGICVCRQGCEIFGFVEPDEKREGRYAVCHRSGVNLLTLEGDVDSHTTTINMTNTGGLMVCTVKKTGSVCEGEVHQHTDAGLMITTLFAAHINRQLLAKDIPSPWDFGFQRTPMLPIPGPAGSSAPSLTDAARLRAASFPPVNAPGVTVDMDPMLRRAGGATGETGSAESTGGTGRNAQISEEEADEEAPVDGEAPVDEGEP